jgi:hypothetical protein
MRRLGWTVAAIAVGMTIAACGEETLDQGELEERVTDDANAALESVNSDMTVDSVSCPDDVASEEGEDAECEVEWDTGVRGAVPIEVTDAESGDVEVGGGAPPLPPDLNTISQEELEETVSAGAQQQIGEAGLQGTVTAVSCAGGVVAEPGTPFECRIEFSDGTAGTVTGEATDDAGNLNFDITPDAG